MQILKKHWIKFVAPLLICLTCIAAATIPLKNSATSLDAFEWQIHQGHMEGCYCHSIPHLQITSNGGMTTLSFSGYHSPGYFDYALTAENGSGNDVVVDVNFDFSEAGTYWHTLYESGFLFNVANGNNGYMVMFGQTDVTLYRITGITSTGAIKSMVDQVPRSPGTEHSMSVHATYNHILFMDNGEVIFDEDIEPTGGIGFGPAVQYNSHNCLERSALSFTRVTGDINKTPPVADFSYNASVADIRTPVIVIDNSRDTNTPRSTLSYQWTVDKINADGTTTRLYTNQPTPFTKYNENGAGKYRTTLMVTNEYGLKSNVVTKDVEITITPSIAIVPEKEQYEVGDTVKFKVDDWFNCASSAGDVVIENIVSKNLYSPSVSLVGSSSISKTSGDLSVVVDFEYKDGTHSSKTVSVPSSGTVVSDDSNSSKELSKITITYKQLPGLAELNSGSSIVYSYSTKSPLSNYYSGGATKRRYEITNNATCVISLGERSVSASDDALTNLIERYVSFSLSGTVDNKNAVTKAPDCNTEFLLTGTSSGGENISQYIVVTNGKSPSITLPYGDYMLTEEDGFTLGYDKINPISVRLDSSGITVNETTKIPDNGVIPFVKPIQVATIDVSRIYEGKYGMAMNSDTDFKVQLTGYPVINNIDASFELTSTKENDKSEYYYDNLNKLILPIGNYTIQETQSYRLVSLEDVTVGDYLAWNRTLNTQDTFKNGKTTIATAKDQSYSVILKYVSDEYVYDEYVYDNDIHFDINLTNHKKTPLTSDDIDRVIVDPVEYTYPITLVNASTREDYCGLVEPGPGISFRYMPAGKYYINCSNNMYLDYEKLEEINSDIEFGEEGGKHYLIIPEMPAYAEYEETSNLVNWRGYSSLSNTQVQIPEDTITHVSLTVKSVDQDEKPVANCEFKFIKDGQILFFVKRYDKWYPATEDEIGATSTFKTNEKGEFYIYKFPVGEYTVQEAPPSDGFKAATPSQTIIVNGTRNMGLVMQFIDLSKIENPVSLSISAAKTLLDKGESLRIANRFMAATAGKDITYISSDLDILSVQPDGLVTGQNKGTAKITAKSSFDDSIVGEIEFVVFDSANPDVRDFRQHISSIRLEVGETYSATTTYCPANSSLPAIAWTSSNPSVATVSAGGTITGKTVGTADITAVCGDITAVCRVTVGKTDIAVRSVTLDREFIQLFYNNKNASQSHIAAMVLPNDASDPSVTYTSSDPDIVSVDSNGNIHARAAGVVTITATSSNGISASCAVSSATLVDSISLSASSLSLSKGTIARLTANVSPRGSLNERDLTWRSLNPDIATVDDSGTITAKEIGRATIIVTASYPGATDVTAECAVRVLTDEIVAESIDISLNEDFATVISVPIEMQIGDELDFWARVNPEATTNPEIEWVFSRTNIIAIGPADPDNFSSQKHTNKYRISAIGTKGGDVTVVGKIKGTDVSATFKVIVDAEGTGISISHESPQTIVLGKSPYDVLDVGVTYDNPFSSARSITWKLSDESKAKIEYPQNSNKNVRIVGKNVGRTTLSVEVVFRYGGTYTDEIELIIEEPRIDILVDGKPTTELTLESGKELEFIVEPNYPKQSANDGYEISTNNNNVSVRGSGNNTANGLGYIATALNPGVTILTITPTDPDVAPFTITITIPGISIITTNTDDGVQLSVLATGVSTSGSVIWVSGDESIATVDSSGMLHPVSNGVVTITAIVGDKTAQITLNIDM